MEVYAYVQKCRVRAGFENTPSLVRVPDNRGFGLERFHCSVLCVINRPVRMVNELLVKYQQGNRD